MLLFLRNQLAQFFSFCKLNWFISTKIKTFANEKLITSDWNFSFLSLDLKISNVYIAKFAESHKLIAFSHWTLHKLNVFRAILISKFLWDFIFTLKLKKKHFCSILRFWNRLSMPSLVAVQNENKQEKANNFFFIQFSSVEEDFYGVFS